MTAAKVALDFANAPFRSPPVEATLSVSVTGRAVTWTADAGLHADAYLVIVEQAGKSWIADRVSGTKATLPAGATLVGIQPVRGKRVGRLVAPGQGTTTSPLTSPEPPRWHRRLEASPFRPLSGPAPWHMSSADVHLTPSAPGLDGSETLTLVSDGSTQVVPLSVLPGTITVSDASGAALSTTRSGNEVDVDLGVAPAAGSSVTLTIDWSIGDLTVDLPAGRGAEATADGFFFAYGLPTWPRLASAGPADPQVTFAVALPSGWTAASSEPATACTGACFGAPPFVPNVWPAVVAGAYQTGSAAFTDGSVRVLARATQAGSPDPAATATFLASAADVYSVWGPPALGTITLAAVSPRNGGVSTYGLILVPDSTLVPALSPDLEFFFAHELSHQWWGGTVYTSDPLDLWLREGMADFSAIRVISQVDGVSVAATAWQTEHDQLVQLMANGYGGQPGRDVPVRPDDPTQLQDYVFYLKGALVLRHLEGVVGSDAMEKALSAYLADHRHLGATTTDFESAVEAASGQALTWFWHEWLSGTGLPEVTFAPYFDPADPSQVEVVLTQVGDEPFQGESWSLPVGVSTNGASGWACADAKTTDLVPPYAAKAPIDACH